MALDERDVGKMVEPTGSFVKLPANTVVSNPRSPDSLQVAECMLFVPDSLDSEVLENNRTVSGSLHAFCAKSCGALGLRPGGYSGLPQAQKYCNAAKTVGKRVLSDFNLPATCG